ncbi:phosphate-starvation-inducible PsiE family protein [Guyparkeria sp.]|uniref:phosphate-starvation-inducible PsiE family protein n=1 Tax=Guyparkeria sp. TaxID=2035736 RepID=UPI0039708D8A
MSRIHLRRSRRQSDLRRYWGVMSISERFEQIIATVLGVIIGVVILLALWELLRLVVETLILQHQNVLDHRVFQKLFGAILTLLIAMEFQHSIIKVIERREHIIQTKIVILIALLALARKFIILDTATTTPLMILALSVGVLVLGVVYWLIEQRDTIRWDREAESATNGPPLHDVPSPGRKPVNNEQRDDRPGGGRS